jgi:hypothetical protein
MDQRVQHGSEALWLATRGPLQGAGGEEMQKRTLGNSGLEVRIDLFYQHRVDSEVPIEDVSVL